jgi:hypothetical protein
MKYLYEIQSMPLSSKLKQKILQFLGRREATPPPLLHFPQQPLHQQHLRRVKLQLLGLRKLLQLRQLNQSKKILSRPREKKGSLPHHRRQGNSKGRP